MIVPINHMVNAIPTLPADLKMTPGVAKILSTRKSTPAENGRRDIETDRTNQLVKDEKNGTG